MSAIKEQTGSAMIAALIVTLLAGTLAGLYLQTVSLETRHAYRSRMAFQAVNLAEGGLEYAIYAMVNDDWSGWEEGSSGFLRDTFTLLNTTYNNEQREVKVYVEPDASPSPRAIAEATITLANGMRVSRQVYIEMTQGTSSNPTQGGGFFANGITAKNTLEFSGNGQQMDSFRSSVNPLGHTDILDIYNDQVTTTILGHNLAGGNCSIATNSVTLTDISVGDADIYGSLATGAASGSTPISDIVGPNGSIYNGATQPGDPTFDGRIDTAFVAYDFYANLPDPEAPDMEDPETTISGKSIGATGTDSEYHISGLNVSGKNTYTVKGNVTLVVDGDFQISGKGSVALEEGATLKLFVSGKTQITGNGLANAGAPQNVIIYSTGTGDVHLGGNGKLSAAVYAPNSFVHLGGGGSSGAMYGAIVGDSVKLNGHFPFHYDEDLANFGVADGDDEDSAGFIPEVSRWVELTDAAERRNMATILTDGL